MPRPSLKEQRREEILEAYVACVALYGLSGATQERIAAHAGIARPLLRHNLGNQDAMIDALVQHVVAAFDAVTDAIAANTNDLSELIKLLFDGKQGTDPQLVLAFQSLIASSSSHEQMRKPLLGCLERYIAMIVARAQVSAPSASRQDVNAVAHGIAAISTSCDAFAPLQPTPAWRTASKRAALLLAKTIGE